jgi:DNA-directed RNA polymerase specialized sigma24 family protein
VSASQVGLGSEAEQPDAGDRSAFAGLYDDHAAHLYDYCLSMLGDEAEAASAVRVTLIAAYMLGGRMTEPGRLRAWMFALARRECLSDAPTRREPWAGPPPRSNGTAATVAEAETREFARVETPQPARTGFEAELQRVVRLVPRVDSARTKRPDEYAEVLDLVERHGIAPAELAAILDLPADDAEDLLAAAPTMIPLRSRDAIAPLASLPDSLWRETASVVFDPGQITYCEAIAADAGRLWAAGFPAHPVQIMPPSHKKMAMTSVGLAAALLAPAALGAGLYAAFAASPHSVARSQHYAIAPLAGTPSSTSASTTSGSQGVSRQKAHHSVISIFPTMPVSAPVTTTRPKSPKPTTPISHKPPTSPPVIKSGSPTVSPTSPSPTSASPTPSPSPSPSPSPTPSPSQSSLPTNGVPSSSNPPVNPSDPSPTDPSPTDPSPSPSG